MWSLTIRTITSSLGIWLASKLISGIEIQGLATLFCASILLGIVNTVARPIIILLTLPITVMTLGLFLWLINTAMLALVAGLLQSFSISGLLSALLGSLVVSITSVIVSLYLGPSGRIEVLTSYRQR